MYVDGTSFSWDDFVVFNFFIFVRTISFVALLMLNDFSPSYAGIIFAFFDDSK